MDLTIVFTFLEKYISNKESLEKISKSDFYSLFLSSSDKHITSYGFGKKLGTLPCGFNKNNYYYFFNKNILKEYFTNNKNLLESFKICTTCTKNKNILEFRIKPKNNIYYYNSICIPCEKKEITEYRNRNRKNYMMTRLTCCRGSSKKRKKQDEKIKNGYSRGEFNILHINTQLTLVCGKLLCNLSTEIFLGPEHNVISILE